MNVLIIGSGGREHTLAWKLKQSKNLNQLFVAPGNAGTAKIASNINIEVTEFEELGIFCLENSIGMVVVGPEVPLVDGVVDYFKQNDRLKNIKIIGPDSQGAQLEGSKGFSKNFMVKYGIPTGDAKTFQSSNIEEGYAFLDDQKAPYVLKADGLAAGKGVIITPSLEDAKNTLKEMLDGKFGDASTNVLIEEHLSGIELSVFVLTDGSNYITMPSAKDYKRIGEGDSGLNTGGMGAVSPVPFATKEFLSEVDKQVIKPTIEGLKSEGIHYVGFIYFGLMKVGDIPYVIEYNARMGDPETEVVMPRLNSDLLELFELAATGKLNEANVEFDERTATTVMLVSGGYPEAYEKGKIIKGEENVSDAIVFHAGTTFNALEELVTNGGRVISLTGFGKDMQEALSKSYEAANTIQFEGKNFRTDIGFDL